MSHGLDRTFWVKLTNPVAARVEKGEGLATIVLPPPEIVIANASVKEGNVGLTPAVFEVTLQGPSSRSSAISYATADGTATAANHDYIPASGVLTFPPGATTATVTVDVVANLAHEEDRTFRVHLSAP